MPSAPTTSWTRHLKLFIYGSLLQCAYAAAACRLAPRVELLSLAACLVALTHLVIEAAQQEGKNGPSDQQYYTLIIGIGKKDH
jgi:hypothetical protein